MRLLARKTEHEFSLTDDIIGDDIPPYAILSHTWGPDAEEVTFKDLTEGTGKNKAGYSKIRFCAAQAASDGLHYLWVDTCCIDKSNNTELSEAINSMFRWYRNASKCYVHLSDVSIGDSNKNDQSTWELAFRQSRWFTRGWTLQELIAPPSVEFFSLEGKLLGDKKSLERQVHEITGIPVQALQGSPLSHFSVFERILWAEKRETKRKEDKAYSLFGIFDLYMPPIYGEGREHAFKRLSEAIDKSSKGKSPPLSSALLKRENALKYQEGINLASKLILLAEGGSKIVHKPFFSVPFKRDEDFVDRDDILARIDHKCSQSAGRVALVGLGGIGYAFSLYD